MNKIKKMSFDEAVLQLEEIVKELEDKNMTLKSSIEKFELGVKISSYCLNKLDEAEKKIEQLTRSGSEKTN
ncbi:MAG: exodeoxyribonuclease VII small subunit [Actinobacteria bacterium]|nr:exodeoxyribonuclease VII small subunit [Actinomycetota bacterium]MBL7060389.1 exodeoxyribonuclease VII small subunit [Actinomycetota bacterium]